MMMNSVDNTLAILVLIFICGLLAAKLTERPRIPDVVAFLVIGILLGPGVLHIISESSQSIPNQFILELGAILILFDGGRGVRFSILKKVWLTITLLSVPGVLVTAAVVGMAAHYFLHLPLGTAFLLAAVISSTDPATLIPVFKRVRIRETVQQTVESESAFNDATGSILTLTVLSTVMSEGPFSLGAPVMSFLISAAGGIGIGIVTGFLATLVVSQKKAGFLHEFGSLVMLVAALLSFFLAERFGTSGFMATFVAGVITGNGDALGYRMREKTQRNIQHFGYVITLVFRMLIFVLLGTQINFQVVLHYLWGGLAVVAALMFVARPLTVFSSAVPDRIANWSIRELGFMCWVRETGVMPAALSGMLLGLKVPGAEVISAVTFIAILATILLQVSTTGVVAKSLGLLIPSSEDEEI